MTNRGMYQLFEFISIFDWVTPTIGFVETFINDPTPLQSNSWTFFIPYDDALDSGWNAVDIEKLLNQHGIKTWGAAFGEGEFFVSIKLEQAQWAEYLLLRHRVPLNERFVGAPAPKRKQQAKQQATETWTALDRFFDW